MPSKIFRIEWESSYSEKILLPHLINLIESNFGNNIKVTELPETNCILQNKPEVPMEEVKDEELEQAYAKGIEVGRIQKEVEMEDETKECYKVKGIATETSKGICRLCHQSIKVKPQKQEKVGKMQTYVDWSKKLKRNTLYEIIMVDIMVKVNELIDIINQRVL